MPNIARRSVQMPNSPIRKLVGYALEAESRGLKVHYLNIGQPDLPSPKEFWEAIEGCKFDRLEYANSLGVADLRQAFVDYYQGKGVSINLGDVLVTNGGSEAALIAFLTLFDPGDEVVVLEPIYANFLTFAAAAGVRLVPVATTIENHFALPSIEEFADAITERTRGILLCNPSNPTGTVYPPAQLHEIAQLVKDRDLFLIVDEVYGDFYYGDDSCLSALQVEGIESRTVIMDSASKKLSLCGARVGFLVSRNADVMAGALKFAQARLSVPTLDQIGVANCLRHTPREYFDAVRKEYIERRDLLQRELALMPGVVCPEIHGAFYAMVRLPIDDSDRFCEWMIREFELENETLLLAPASGFYITPGRGKDEVRIAYVLETERLKRAMAVLRGALAAYPQVTERVHAATA
jgi:aspartate aminotransferase